MKTINRFIFPIHTHIEYTHVCFNHVLKNVFQLFTASVISKENILALYFKDFFTEFLLCLMNSLVTLNNTPVKGKDTSEYFSLNL